MKKLTILVGAIAIALVSSSPALAKRHHHRHHRRHHQAARVTMPVAQPSFFQAGSDLVSAARSEIGNGAIYGRSSLWCARFMNVVLQRTGRRGTGSDMAASFAGLPKTSMHVGAIAVMHRRRGGGHVGVVSGIDAQGNPIVISGNNAGRVREASYPRSRVYAFVEPQ